MNSDIVNEILEMIPSVLFPRKGSKPVLELFLEKDLGIYGDDAAEFLEKYSQKFNVDISNFNFPTHFTSETPFYIVRKYLLGINKKDLTIKDLEEGVIKGKLV
jgi:hypothetical protein